ncbi:23S rRNA (uracil(747)-C(5))-methyltransferase RlmC [Flavimobilis marinus]|uniref:23S rRNA m(5)U-747 methyltransferase n=2 Tax=Flavimobilis marinus TaxID=285351 RepID=A0A1I2I2D9_9MICO|nr:23S rRNA (uracil(747)-C(5))-methyltransferase RlmC [Flavimobilis marinus]SFF35237.1 23S rRNA m(5)U-747 methyltransferase [Flavimobilis marinus]
MTEPTHATGNPSRILELMQCSYFDSARCSSCTLLLQPYEEQIAGKDQRSRDLLAAYPDLEWLPPVTSAEAGFRNKAKMVVSGTAAEPIVGILDERGLGVDLRNCPLYTPGLRAAFPALAAFITHANLTPYDVPGRRGELKHLLITESPDGELMVRFVLRSQEPVSRIRKHLPALLEALPQIRVASANLLPEHKAVLEGSRELPLTEQTALPVRMNDVTLYLRAQSFFQTNTPVAATLYRQARAWVDEAAPRSIWDLYCGVGGFALHCADDARDVVGVETSVEATASANLSRDELALTEPGAARVTFHADDATAFALAAPHAPDLVIVNPPRRGIGPTLAGWLESASAVRTVIYSSCNAESLARDLAAMPSFAPRRAQVLDMFPQTGHFEVLVLLERA